MGKKFYAMMAVLAFAAGSMDVNAVSLSYRRGCAGY